MSICPSQPLCDEFGIPPSYILHAAISAVFASWLIAQAQTCKGDIYLLNSFLSFTFKLGKYHGYIAKQIIGENLPKQERAERGLC